MLWLVCQTCTLSLSTLLSSARMCACTHYVAEAKGPQHAHPIHMVLQWTTCVILRIDPGEILIVQNVVKFVMVTIWKNVTQPQLFILFHHLWRFNSFSCNSKVDNLPRMNLQKLHRKHFFQCLKCKYGLTTFMKYREINKEEPLKLLKPGELNEQLRIYTHPVTACQYFYCNTCPVTACQYSHCNQY